jgi:hypothetical protein
MPKNTYLIKENYKKVEEIREIKSEIPSYEEFLKVYQQGQVNYDDLTNNDISSNKDYGPMWGNSQYGERWINLRIPCPVIGCNDRSVINQTHTCGGQAEISSKARIRCRSCGAVSHVRDFKFSCSNYGRGNTDMASFTDALIVALDYKEMNTSVVAELIRNLRNSW